MPLLTSNTIIENREIVVANQVLQDNGCKEIALAEEDLQTILKEEGLTLRNAVRSLRHLTEYADSDSVKLQAISKALDLHKATGNQDNGKTLNFFIAGQNDTLQFNNILNPQR
jgi:hypothetical protein